jgi:hypothetical protein
VSEPVTGTIPRKTRRRSRRHIRNRRIRRSAAIALLAICTTCFSAVILNYLSPTLFQSRSTPPSFENAELSRSRLITLNQLLAQAPALDRPVYQYSVVPGGIEDAKELKWVAEHDPIVAAHYAGFDYDHARVVRLTLARTVYLSYRIGNRIYWTRHRITLHKGEKVITDGRMTARGRCANRVEEVPQQAVSDSEPPAVKFDQPVGTGPGTATQAPPVPFQSALLNRPAIGPAGPLSLYDPIVGSNFVSIASPPIPTGLCGPSKKKGTVESGCCVGEITPGKKKTGGPCGNGGGGLGTVPEPGTWILFVSGLAFVGWQGRKRFARC